MKKGLNRIVATCIFLTLALGPVSGSSAHVTWHCPPGVKDHHYCSKDVHCQKGGTQQHDCRNNND
jgi:hypothetical protein